MGYDERADDEHCVSAIVSLFKHLGHEGKLWQRVFAKFQEANYEKVERLVEMFQRYLGQVLDVEDSIDKKRQELEAEGVEIGDVEENGFYMDKLDAGLFTLQLVARIIGTICKYDATLKESLIKLLGMQNLNVDSVKVVLRDYAQSLGEFAESGEGPESMDPNVNLSEAEMQQQSERKRVWELSNEL